MVILKQHTENNIETRIVGFVCNWSAYSGVEMAGVDGIEYPASVKLVRVMCLGRLHLGLILKAFELGANGVILLGCPTADCHYESGMERAKELFAQTKKVLNLLGIEPKRLALAEIPLGRGDILAGRLSSFVKSISQADSNKLRSRRKVASQA
ncbi:hydrogenase iron-sulfur subunit [Chloroflexota bacterium]